jgi:hypothetical protein
MFPRFTGRWAKFEGDVTVPVDSALLSRPKTMRCTHGTARAYPGTLRKATTKKLEQLIHDEMAHPDWDEARVSALKKEKLRIKDELERLRSSVH